jgi:hypothetical protein
VDAKDIAGKWYNIKAMLAQFQPAPMTPEMAFVLGMAQADIYALANEIATQADTIRNLQLSVRQLLDELEGRLPDGERMANVVARWSTPDHAFWDRQLDNGDIADQADRDMAFVLAELEKRVDTDRGVSNQRVLVWSEPAL